MYKDLEGKVGLVSGSGKRTGIGYAMAEGLAASGCQVVIADLGNLARDTGGVAPGNRRDMDGIAADLSQKYGVRTLAVDLDVSSMESVTAMADQVKAEFGRVDVLCNNAGATFGVPATIHGYDEAAWLRTIDINLHGVYRVCRAIVPLMTASGASIINTASRAGKFPPLFNGAYAVSKAGVIMLTKVMAKELAGQGIRVNAVCPGQIMTDLEAWRFGLEAQLLGQTPQDREDEMCKTIPLGRIGRPEEVGQLTAFLASNQASYITGQAINVCGGQQIEI